MTQLVSQFSDLIAQNLNVSTRNIKSLRLISSYSYSPTLFDEMTEVLSQTIIDELKTSNIIIGLDGQDAIFVCQFKSLDRSYTAVIYDYAELYYPTLVWKIFAN